jgi:riboflavin synthase
MFTGLVADTGVVTSIEASGDGSRLEVRSRLAGDLEPGGSVAVNGVCLTATEASEVAFGADVVSETLRRSSLGALAEGDAVNLELPLRPADRLGGHIVQGHVDGVGAVESIAEEGPGRRISVRAEQSVCRYVVHKGSVAVDGVSLTAVEPTDEGFDVALIPETVARTTLGRLGPGDAVNIEVDVLAKYVEKLAPDAAVTEPATFGGGPG